MSTHSKEELLEGCSRCGKVSAHGPGETSCRARTFSPAEENPRIGLLHQLTAIYESLYGPSSGPIDEAKFEAMLVVIREIKEAARLAKEELVRFGAGRESVHAQIDRVLDKVELLVGKTDLT